jgi:hypothetical protein
MSKNSESSRGQHLRNDHQQQRATQLAVLKQLAEQRGGACLSLWRCHNGHVWEASADQLRQGD